jgi:hypothetical protein
MLYLLEDILSVNNKTLDQVYLPTPTEPRISNLPKIIRRHYEHNKTKLKKEFQTEVETLNQDQLSIFNQVVAAIEAGNGGLFFLDAPGGTGKTYLLNLLLKYCRSIGLIAIGTATTGIASHLLDFGETTHCNDFFFMQKCSLTCMPLTTTYI